MSYLISLILLLACGDSSTEENAKANVAHVKKVTISGTENNYTFHVTIASPDTGCEQYADWWEVVSTSGELIYRRILGHSHVAEQPFTRSGGKIAISNDEVVWVRAHMNAAEYGGMAMKGSIASGFSTAEFPNDLGAGLDKEAPLPSGCAF